MKNAKEMRTITNKKIEEETLQKLKKMMKDYIEKEIAPKIEEMASQGYGFLAVKIDTTKASIVDVAEELIANDYVVREMKHSRLMISW